MATYYVNAATGNDGFPGTSPGLPFATIVHADTVVQPGDNVLVYPGAYNLSSTSTFTANGTANAPINYITANLKPWLRPGPANNAVISGGNSSTEFIQLLVKGNYNYWTGFEFTDPTASVCFDLWGTHCKVSNCYIHDVGGIVVANTPGAGIFDSGSNGAAFNEFANNRIVRMGAINATSVSNSVVHCIYTSGSHDFIHHNICIAAPGYGIVSSGTTNTNDHDIIANNLCAENGNSGIAFGCQTGSAVDFMYCVNNVLVNNGKLGGNGHGIVEVDGNSQTGTNSIYDHNLTFGNSGSAYSLQNSLVATNQITARPTFRAYAADGSGDYHPASYIPTIGAGTSTLPVWNTAFGWTVDMDGLPIPSSGAADLGPYTVPLPAGNTFTTFQVGSYTASSDTWNPTLDLNDQANFYLMNGSPQLPQPPKVTVNSFNVRTPGETVVRTQFKNRHIKASLTIRGSTPQAIVSNAHALITAVEGLPYTLRIALPRASAYTYADVKNCVHNIPSDPLKLQQLAIVKAEVDFECYPFLRGDRLTLSNLVVNPGFEAPSGPGVTVFSDPLSTVNAYTPQLYKAAVLTDAPLRYYRLQEVTGTTAVDIGSQALNGTYTGGFTLGQQPAPAGGSDYDVLFNGTTGYVSLPTTGLPSGTAAWSMECLANFASNPSGSVYLIAWGATSLAAQIAYLQITATGTAHAGILNAGTAAVSNAALSLGAWHHLIVTYSGGATGTFTLYVDGTAQTTTGTGAAVNLPTAAGADLAALTNIAGFYPGQLAECAIYSTVLSGARVTAHYNASTPVVLAIGPANTYPDIVFANGGAQRFYRFGLGDSGTTALDIAGGGNAGTTHGSPTTGTAGGISGDTDTAYTLASASSQFISCPTTGLPIGNNPFTIHVWYWFSANPAATSTIAGYGGSGAHGSVAIWIDTSGKLNADFNGVGGIIAALASSLSTWHHAALTWNGTTLTLYQDGASVGTPTTPGAGTIAASPVLNWGSNFGGSGLFWNGRIDEGVFVSSALTSTQVSNIYTAGHSGATGTLANAASLPSGGRVAFGSPKWAAVNTWNFRLRYTTSEVLTAYLHFTDGNNYLACQVAAGGSNFFLNHRIGGVSNTLASATVPLQHEGYYWLSFTQFPTVAGNAPYLQAILSYDNNGNIGAAIATLTSAAQDAVTAEVGAPQFGVSGAACIFGGPPAGGGNAVALFGPGGWTFQPVSGGGGTTGQCSGSWDQTAANTYPGGPVTSFGCARVDLAPAGTVDTCWRLYLGGAPAGSWAIPIAAAGDVLGVSAYVKSSGLSASALLRLYIFEYDASGTFLSRSGVVQTLSGNQAAWTQISGTYTTGASCAYADLELRVIDTTVAGESANATVWWDNAQVWDQTTTGQSSMPYCELRFPQSPAQLMVSGLLGNVQAPAQVSLGSYLASLPSNTALTYYLGRRAQVNGATQLINYTNNQGVPGITATLDAASYGGFYWAVTSTNGITMPEIGPVAAATLLGTYELLERTWCSETTLANLSVQADQVVNSLTAGVTVSVAYNGTILAAPFTAASAWQTIQAGQTTILGGAAGNTTDLTQISVGVEAFVTDTTGTNFRSNVAALLPIDATILISVFKDSTFAATGIYQYVYFDGTLPSPPQGQAIPSWNRPSNALAAPAAAAPGSLTNIKTLSSSADPFLTVDPTLSTSTASGVNQLLAFLASADGQIWPALIELQYSPLFLYPRP